ncbi:cytochrome c oxidase subunit 4 [Streptacidiphilus sp. EB129]|uniref:aa3-type cytochrome oxidase subunit IV n=1 Tax=Streptacidiphilus sp. EB129 TaxID=3156262 RepID=UPI00351215AC
MKAEGWLFAGMSAYFTGTACVYWALAGEPAGTAALTVAALMSALVAVFFFVQYVRRGPRAQDRGDAETVETAGPLAFFPPRSAWPVALATGFTLAALGIVYELWILLLGFGLLSGAVLGFVFQYVTDDA